MNKKTKAFTLIELVVGITISMMLMVSVGIFVNNGMANVITQQKVIKNTTELTDFTAKIHQAINLTKSGAIFPIKTNSGIIFKRDKNLGDGGFSYIGYETMTGVYCKNEGTDPSLYPESDETKNVFIKNFIPFEEHNYDGSNEDIFTDYKKILNSNISGYISFQKGNIIKYGGNTIIGKGIFGNKFENGTSGTDIYLNGPTGLAKNGNILFISDTLNNRILWYDTNTKKIYKLLDVKDGLNEPTGLYYNNTEKALYIANSGNGEILKYSSKKQSSIPKLTMSGFSENNINKIEVGFSGSNEPNLDTEGSWNITSNFSDDVYKKRINDTILVYSNKKNTTKSSNSNCSSNGQYLFEDSNDTNKPTFYCTESGTGKLLSYPTSTISKIEISNLSDFKNTGTYYVNLKLFNNDTEKYSKTFPFFTQGDDDILTPDDNILEVVESGLNYPTGLWWSYGIKYNEFGDGSYSDLEYDKNNDTLLETPIDYLNINISDNLLSIVLKYYKKYNCYNLDEKTKRTYLFNKDLK